MNVLVLGGGGREHALAYKISESRLCENLYTAPGNAGTDRLAVNINLSLSDFESINTFVRQKQIDMVVVGPEAPLVKGLSDFLRERNQNLRVIGPGREGAQLEGSKDFAKKFMQKYKIPTAKAETFGKENLEDGISYIHEHFKGKTVVLKADGLAAGKGVIITADLAEAEATLREMIEKNKFGEASSRVLIEEYLDGIELSVFVLTDGTDYKVLPSAKDYKRIGEGDTGLNTGGMGAVSPVPFADRAFMKNVREQVIEPTLLGLQKENIPYTGFIFFGFMKVGNTPYMLEYNVRLGDPETEVVLPRIKSDFLHLLQAAAEKRLQHEHLEFHEGVATTVMVVSGGYPEAYEKGKVISGLDQLPEDVRVFHAGTKNEDGKVLTDGGRVMAFTALGKNTEEALKKSLAAAEQVKFEGKYFRKDIGFDL